MGISLVDPSEIFVDKNQSSACWMCNRPLNSTLIV